MSHSKSNRCAICGEERTANGTRFLVAENQWEDKLTILEWNEQMASRRGIQAACSVNHVEELVIHWMTTGSLDYPFARTTLGSGGWHQDARPDSRAALRGARPIGELAVHRESVERVLAENPQSLQVILDALLDALRREETSSSAPIAARGEQEQEEEKELCGVSSEPER
jgi:hypothetical protein